MCIIVILVFIQFCTILNIIVIAYINQLNPIAKCNWIVKCLMQSYSLKENMFESKYFLFQFVSLMCMH